ncbi:MAG: YiiX/YebB-like N1pC/P60 family cysteine hydrolase [Pirellulales bacterium]
MVPEQIASDVRTVISVAAHFAELKQSAAQLLASVGATDRGYFTPTEDEEVRHLLVSYWQSRNALIELVTTCYQNSRISRQGREADFLTAYAGALVLIDAARFLREHVHQRPVVRAKLNEPEPHFGVPPGTYDAIQKSLTSSVHAWHLYHAAHYFDSHKAELRTTTNAKGLDDLFELIDRLQERLNIRIEEYALARLRDRTRRVATLVHRDLLGRALYGLQKSVSRLISDVYTIPGHHPVLPEAVQKELCALLQPGDVLITRKEHALTNYFLPGFWPHAALFLGTPRQLEQLGLSEHANVKPRWRRLLECDLHEPRRVLEAMKDGVWIRSVASPFGSDAIAVLRPRLTQEQIAGALARGLFHEGKPYDFDFDFTRSDRLVCTEVVYRSYEGVGGVSFSLTRRAGRLTLAAEDLVDMALARQFFDTLAVVVPQQIVGVATGSAAEHVIRTIAARRSAASMAGG